MRRAAPGTGPATERRREAGLATEARACIPKRRLEAIGRKVARGQSIERNDLKGCPTAERIFRQVPSAGPALGRAAAMTAFIARRPRGTPVAATWGTRSERGSCGSSPRPCGSWHPAAPGRRVPRP